MQKFLVGHNFLFFIHYLNLNASCRDYNFIIIWQNVANYTNLSYTEWKRKLSSYSVQKNQHLYHYTFCIVWISNLKDMKESLIDKDVYFMSFLQVHKPFLNILLLIFLNDWQFCETKYITGMISWILFVFSISLFTSVII